MATWTGTGAHNANYTGTLTVTESSYDIANNSSTVSYSVVLTGNSGYYYQDIATATQVSINGTLVQNRNEQITMPSPSGGVSSVTICSGTAVIPHNADGTKTITVWAKITTPSTQYYLPGEIKIPSGLDGSLTLTTIPRASTMSVPDFTIESAGVMTITMASSSFSHTITYYFEGLTGTAATVSAGVTSVSWTPPSTFYAKLPNSTSGVVSLVLHTFSGATEIGSNTYNRTVYVGSGIKPTVPSITLYPVNTNAWLNSKGLYVGGYTKLRVVSSATAGSGASISAYAVSNAFTATGADVTSANALAAGSRTVNVAAIDSRGRSNSNNKSVSFLSYSNPTISLSAERGTYSGGSWTANVSGDHIRVTAISSVSLSANGNTGTVTVKIGASNPNATSGNYYYFTGTVATSSYTVSGSVTDSVGNTGSASLSVGVTAVASTMTYTTLNIGGTSTFTITRNNSNFTHTITATLGTQSTTVGTGIGTSTTWSIPYGWLAQIPNATSKNGTLTLSTYRGATLVGTTEYTAVFFVPYQIVPTAPVITLSPVNTNAWISSQGLYVGGYTKLNVQSAATAGSGASMSSYLVSGEFSATGANVTSSSVLNAGNKTVTVTATDSRGRTNSNTASVTFLSYTYPSLTTFEAVRGTYSGGSWTSNELGAHIRVTAVASVALSGQGNTGTVTVKIGATNPSATSGNYYYFTGTNATTSYTITGSVTDSVGNTSSRGITVPTVEVPVNFNVDLPGVGFGMIAQNAHSVEIAQNWSLNANGKGNTFAYMPSSWSTYGASSTLGYARIATVTITDTYSSGPIEFVCKRYGDNAEVKLYLVFVSTGDNNDPALYSFTYDCLSTGMYTYAFSAFTYRTAASTWDVYVNKAQTGAWIDVSTYVPLNFKDHFTITYAHALLTSVPSGATVAKPKPAIEGTITASSGVTIVTNKVSVNNSGVYVQFYGTRNSNYYADTGATVGTISGVPLPPYAIRFPAGTGVSYVYLAYHSAYGLIDTSGNISITVPSANVADRAFIVNAFYPIL